LVYVEIIIGGVAPLLEKDRCQQLSWLVHWDTGNWMRTKTCRAVITTWL